MSTAKYFPPTCPFDRVLLNVSVTAEGMHHDKIGILHLSDVELWRMTTPLSQPKLGIAWSYLKDMTAYNARWRLPGTIYFELLDLFDSPVHANATSASESYRVSVTATFFKSAPRHRDRRPADWILPLSEREGLGEARAFRYPAEEATRSLRFPRNVKRAIMSIAATPMHNDEFWWSQVPSAVSGTFNSSMESLHRGSALREVVLKIDGRPAGYVLPQLVLFSGGIAAPLSRPAMQPQGLDIREHNIDLTPWLPVLCDGEPHVLSLEAVAHVGTAEGGPYSRVVPDGLWLLSGKAFLWLDDPKSITTGPKPKIVLDTHEIILRNPVATDKRNMNMRMESIQEARRVFEVESILNTSEGTQNVAWRQVQKSWNTNAFAEYGFQRALKAEYKSSSQTKIDSVPDFHHTHMYTLSMDYKTHLAPKERYEDAYAMHLNLSTGVSFSDIQLTPFPRGYEPWRGYVWSRRRSTDGTATYDERVGRAELWKKRGEEDFHGAGELHARFQMGYTKPFAEDAQDLFSVEQMLYERVLRTENERLTHDRAEAFKLHEYSHSNQKPLDGNLVPTMGYQGTGHRLSILLGHEPVPGLNRTDLYHRY